MVSTAILELRPVIFILRLHVGRTMLDLPVT